MTSLSAAILVATCTATFGLHSSSSTTSSYSYFAFGSALRSFTARSAELRPPMPLTETPPVSGPMKPTLTASLAKVEPDNAQTSAARAAAVNFVLIIRMSPTSLHRRGGRVAAKHARGRLCAYARAAYVRRQVAGSGRTDAAAFEISSRLPWKGTRENATGSLDGEG